MSIDFANLISNNNLLHNLYDAADWLEWRICYHGGRLFREEFLEKFDRETVKDFERRRKLTPIPTFAKREINRVRNSLAQRFPDITRRGGSKVWQDAVTGVQAGVDRRGSTMDAYLAKYIVPEMLVMGKVGVLVDAPVVKSSDDRPPTLADVPKNFRPYLNYYPVEQMPTLVRADIDSPSDWSAVMIQDLHTSFELRSGVEKDSRTYRHYWLEPERGNLVNVQKLDESGNPIGDVFESNLDAIPFVLFDIQESLMAEACSYQVTMLNMISADSSYAIDSNYPFLTRQRGNNNAGAWLDGADDDKKARTGTNKGLFYDKGLERPGFISPPIQPIKISLELRKELKDEVHQLVMGTLADLGDSEDVDAGLAFIGACLKHSEQRLWDHWTAFEEVDPKRRKVPTISYPTTWSLKTDAERIEEADKILDLQKKIPGMKGKKEAAKSAVDKMYRGKLATETIDAMLKEIDDADYSTSDPDIIEMAKEQGMVDAVTGSLALGFAEGVAEKAKEDQAERAAMITAAQADAAEGAARGNPDGSADPNSNKLAREGEADTTAKLGGEDEKGVRGEGK